MKEIIRFDKVSYNTDIGREIFNELSMSIGTEKVGIVGRNGVGKTTLLKLIIGDLQPYAGRIIKDVTMFMVPQIINYDNQYLDNILKRLKQNFVNANIEPLVKKVLKRINLAIYENNNFLRNLSGGEVKLLYIMEAFTKPVELLILDEPEGDLDSINRKLLQELIIESKKVILIASHDRKILNCVDSIIEVKEQGVQKFGGGYNKYFDRKKHEDDLLDRNIRSISNEIDKIDTIRNSVINNQKYRMQKGKNEFGEKGYGDFWCDTPKKDRAAKTLKKLQKKHEEKVIEGKKALESYINDARIINNIKIPFTDLNINSNEIILMIDKINFYYYISNPIIENFSIEIRATQKIWLYGKNGSGKTTLMKLINGDLIPKKGSLENKCISYAFFDQRQESLINDLSLADCLLKENEGMPMDRIFDIIQTSGFPLSIAKRKCASFSGGERIIASLIIALSKKIPPQLLLLDEPTNHLDLTGIRQLEIILKNYKGAVIIATHDEELIERVGNYEKIELGL